MWFHVPQSECDKRLIIIVNDSDVWMYALAIPEAGYLIDKEIIALLTGKKYILLNTALTCIRNNGSLEELVSRQIAAMSLLEILSTEGLGLSVQFLCCF